MYEVIDELKKNAQKRFEKNNAKSSEEKFKQGE